ncbi:MAG: hypothetical protein CM1200mP24_02390 [Gammaproteobacteria bacterium]|nr:MAG: hypothetical protein CM1200mP24_02390 [Gammaproteobacteria bacterium]
MPMSVGSTPNVSGSFLRITDAPRYFFVDRFLSGCKRLQRLTRRIQRDRAYLEYIFAPNICPGVAMNVSGESALTEILWLYISEARPVVNRSMAALAIP